MAVICAVPHPSGWQCNPTLAGVMVPISHYARTHITHYCHTCPPPPRLSETSRRGGMNVIVTLVANNLIWLHQGGIQKQVLAKT